MKESLSANTSLSHYRILARLGAGGMGEVYLAEDTRLGRKVALKLLPAEFTRDAERVRRFEQEARAASALNHPNIVTVYDLGEAEAGRFIVMELVAGRTLRALIAEDNSVEILLALGTQMAKALVAAHAAGITHRDIKPDNIMVREDGYVKVLDFGLARLMPATATDSDAATLSHHTTPGALVGTVAYMSPEQARGETVTNAADIFALGIVFYELATGEHPFKAGTMIGILHSITSESSLPPSRLNPEIPAALEALILRMLEKDARLRPTAVEVEAALRATGRLGDWVTGGREDDAATASPRRSVAPSPRRVTVGRERERAELRAGFESALAGRGLMVCVAGEPGIGKTTLVEDFLSELAAENQCAMARGRCSERLAGTEAYLPLLEALESLLHSGSHPSAARVMKQLAPTWYAQLVPLSGDDEEMARLLSEVRAASQERMKRELGALFQEVSRLRPLVLFFDDLHWADVSTIDLLSFLAGKFDALNVLIVVTYRPSDMLLSKHPFLQIKPDLQARGVCRELQLEFLNEAEIAQYLALEFPSHHFPVEFPKLIHAKTEGSPLFMADLVRYLRDRGVIAKDSPPNAGEAAGAPRWILAQTLPDIERELPESVRGMIERKIAQLGEDDRKLLTAASVQGYEFDSAVVAQVLKIDADEVEERLEKLERVYAFVRLRGEEEFPDGTLTLRYRFVHVLYQNALYAQLRATRRASMSATVAQELLGFYGKQRDAVAAQLAVLYSAARDFARAVEFYLLAVQRAAQVFAHAEAAALARRGVELLEKLPETPERARQELRLQTRLGASLMVVKGYGAPEVLKTHLRMRELCQQLGDQAQLLRAQLGLSIVYIVRAEYGKARELARQCLRLAESTGDLAMKVQSHFSLGLSLQYLGEFVPAREQFELSLALYDHPRHSAISLYGAILNRAHLGRVLTWLGYYDAGRKLIEEALEVAEEIRHPVGLVNALSVAAFVEVFHRRMPQTLEIAGTMIAQADEHGYPYYRAIGLILRGFVLAMQGEYEEGIGLMRTGLAAHQAAETWQQRATYLILLAEALGEAGRTEEALAALEEAAEAIRRTGEHCYEAELCRLKGELLLQQGDPAAAGNCFRQAIEVARQQRAKSWELRAATSLGRLWQQQGKRAEAHEMLAEIYGWFTEGFDTADLKEAKALLDALA